MARKTQIGTISDIGVGMGGEARTFKPTNKGTLAEYRRMNCGPTIALAMAMTMSAIRSSEWSMKSKDGVPDQVTKAASEMIMPLRSELLRQAMFSLAYGFQTVHMPWKINSTGQFAPECLRPIMPEDLQDIEVDQYTYKPQMFCTKEAEFPATEVLHFAYDSEGANPFGRSRHENIREFAWGPWKDALLRMKEYTRKHASTVPIVTYPQGRGKVNGTEYDNNDIAQLMLDTLPTQRGVRIPRVLIPGAEQLIKQGAKPEDLLAWSIKFIEAASGFGGELLPWVQHLESLQMRGWFVPEKAGIQGDNGGRAVADSHAGVMMDNAQDTARWIVKCINEQIIDKFVVLNFGSSLKGKVYLEAAAINEERKAFLSNIVTQVLVNPANIDLFLSTVDVDSAMDQTGVPKSQAVVDPASLIKSNPPAPVDPNAPKPPTPPMSKRQQSLVTFLGRYTKDMAV